MGWGGGGGGGGCGRCRLWCRGFFSSRGGGWGGRVLEGKYAGLVGWVWRGW